MMVKQSPLTQQTPSITPHTAAPPRVNQPRRVPNFHVFDHSIGSHTYPTRSNSASRQTHQISHQCNSVTHPTTGKPLEYRHLISGPDKHIWETAFANEIGRLANGVVTRIPHGTNTIQFIHRVTVPIDKRPTYGHLVSTIRPTKSEVYRIRLTVGENLIFYPGNVSTPMDDLSTTKILINSVVSSKISKLATADIKYFHLNSHMDSP